MIGNVYDDMQRLSRRPPEITYTHAKVWRRAMRFVSTFVAVVCRSLLGYSSTRPRIIALY
jgi:hypothetical protein